MDAVLGSIGGDLANRLDADRKKKNTYEVVIDTLECIKCSQCIEACKPGALDMNDNITYNPGKCTRCGLCAESCPVDAIKICK
ncbi:MAG: hypothetical protein A7316_07805 [Candidatus Altiarchaeales archaeon WOR_SM1_86-2]|nr:MAG: hypothetical protein A7316_07805 [Candidatus Altiarchaeales archaeon WOR_SM1_86-2]